MKKVLFVFNPNSGRAEIKNRLLDIVNILTLSDYEVTVYPTKAPMDGYEYLLENGGRFDIIACSGGDGTLNETVGAVLKLNEKYKKRFPIGYIPSGTTNDFARTLGIPRDMKNAAAVIGRGRIFNCDIGMVNGKKNFNYVAAFGAFTEVSYATPQEMKNIFGHQAYIFEGMKSLGDLKPQYFRIKADNINIEGSFLYGMVSNTSSVGGIKGVTGKGVDLSDGLFEVTLVRAMYNPIEMSQGFGALLSMDYEDSKVIESFKTNHIEFESVDYVAWTFDGEFGGVHKGIVFDVLPGAVDFLVR